MKQNLYIRIDHHQRIDYLLRDNNSEVPLSGSAFHQDQLPEFPTNAIATLIVPGADVLILQLTLPKTSRSQLLKVIPYALEEQLIEDIDALHFSPSKQNEDGSFYVAVVKKQLMQQWQERCAALGLYPQVAIPDYLALPLIENAWHLYLSGEDALIRQNRMQGISIAQSQLKEMLPLCLAENAKSLPEKIIMDYDDGNEHFAIEDLAQSSVPIEMADGDRFSMELFAEGLSQPAALNLLHGEYLHSKPRDKNLNLWKWVAILACAWVVIWLLGDITKYFVYQHRLRQAEAKVLKLYQQAFPQAKAVVEPRLRIQRALSNAQNVNSGGPFLSLLTQVGEQINKLSGTITIVNFNYHNNTLIMSLSANNFQALAALTQTLRQQGLVVQQQNSSTQGKIVTSRLTIKESHRG